MKNLKVRDKLRVGFGIIIALIVLISTLSIMSLIKVNNQSKILAEKSLSNTQMIWEIRRNNLSGERYILMSLMEKEQNLVNNYIESARNESKSNQEVMKRFQQNHRINQNLVDDLDKTFEEQIEKREQLYKILESVTPETQAEAYNLYMTELYPILSEQNTILTGIHNAQMNLTDKELKYGNKIYYGTQTLIIFIVLIAIAISSLVTIKLTKAIVIPLNEITNATNALAEGDFSANLTYESKDEFGKTCNSIQTGFEQLKKVINNTADALGQLADGNFAFDTDFDFNGEMKEIQNAAGALMEKMNVFFYEIKTSASQIHDGSAQVANGAQSLAQGATEQASSLQELASSISIISNNVSENAINSKKANDLATMSGEVAKATMNDMKEMLSAMNEISISTENIGKVIKVIDDITFQTNILSLNAAVEAARAGSAGKGFAVVADEVRNLAQKSSESAKEITDLVESTISAVKKGENIAQKTSEAFDGLADSINDVVSTVNEIAIATEGQADSIKQITIGVDQISAVVQTNSATSEESAAASEELSAQANTLNNLLEQFKLK